MSQHERYRGVALGLTLLNAGLGITLWSAICEVAGAKWNLVALFLVPAGFLVILGCYRCGRIPDDTPTAFAAWSALVPFALFYICGLYALAVPEEHRFPPWTLGLAGAGLAGALFFVRRVMRHCGRRLHRDFGVSLSWWFAAAMLAATIFAGVAILPDADMDTETKLRVGGVLGLFTVATLGNALLKAKALVVQIQAATALGSADFDTPRT